MRILHLEPETYPPELLDRLRAVGEVDLLADRDRATLLERLGGAQAYDALFVRLGCRIDAEALALQPSLRFVVTPTTGLDHIDLAEAERCGVRVVSLADEAEFLRTVRSTAEHTWALLLALARRLPELAERGRNGIWERAGSTLLELDGRTLGVVGLGRLGRMVAGYGQAFGMRVLGHDERAVDVPGVHRVGLDELLADADAVTLHVPGSRENAHLLDAARLARMKPGAVLVNTARGELVDEAALLAALESGRLAGVALDVLAGDPSWDGSAPPDHPLLAFARRSGRLLVTPHVGGYGDRSVERTRAFVTERFLEALG